MNMIREVLMRLTTQYHRIRCNLSSRQILVTQPITTVPSNLVIVSCVSKTDLNLYLVAIKTLYKQIAHGSLLILDDGTLDENSRNLIRSHVSECKFEMLNEVPFSKGQKGTRWGLILRLADLCEDSYVIQIDSDTITLDDIPEVKACVRDNISFTLGTNIGRKVESMTESSKRVEKSDSTHVQILAEKAFEQITSIPEKKYVRGNAGFIGLAKGSVSRTTCESFLQEMKELIGEPWMRHGSNQVTCNVMLANSPKLKVLDVSKYACVTPDIERRNARFLHLIGTYRFANSLYHREIRKAIFQLQSSAGE